MEYKEESAVVCRLPKAGLGNQLFPLMKAIIFAHINQLPLVITGYHRLRIGPYLRREKSTRNYRNYFTFQKSIFGEWLDTLHQKWLERTEVGIEPALNKIDGSPGKTIFRFEAIPHWDNYFDQLKERRELAIELFWKHLREDVKGEVARLSPPVIGVHIRMGDFRKLKSNENFASVGSVRTPEEYFVEIIQSIRKMAARDLPVSIFTDGFKREFTSLPQLTNISFVEGNRDIVDMILLSKSKIIVTSAGSTFSYWAGFLSDAPIILHPEHIHQPFRHGRITETVYEGGWSEGHVLLLKNIRSIVNDTA